MSEPTPLPTDPAPATRGTGLGDAAPATRGAGLGDALAALDALAELGETIEDEWTYVTALADAGRSRLRAAAGPDLGAALPADRGAAIAAACAETARIEDPHRAIDWLSTFPAVVELALGGPPAGPPAGTAPGTPATDASRPPARPAPGTPATGG
jgi:hypothetical protein